VTEWPCATVAPIDDCRDSGYMVMESQLLFEIFLINHNEPSFRSVSKILPEHQVLASTHIDVNLSFGFWTAATAILHGEHNIDCCGQKISRMTEAVGVGYRKTRLDCPVYFSSSSPLRQEELNPQHQRCASSSLEALLLNVGGFWCLSRPLIQVQPTKEIFLCYPRWTHVAYTRDGVRPER
jgi:hypothetical protein